MKKIYLKSYFDFNDFYLFFIIILTNLNILYLTNKLILNTNFYFNILGEQGELPSGVESIVEKLIYLQKIGYLILPLLLSLKIYVIAGVVYIGSEFSEMRLEFRIILKIVLLSEIINLFGEITKFGYFLANGTTSITELKSFYPLSILNLIKSVPSYLLFPLKFINLFELAYCLVLVIGIKLVSNISFLKSFKIILSTYGVLLFTFILFIMFIQLQFT